MNRLCLPLALLALLLGALSPSPVEGREPPRFPGVPHHYVALRLDLAGHRIVAKDTIAFASTAPSPLRVRLNPDLEILAVSSNAWGGALKPGAVTPVEGERGVYELDVQEDATDVEIRYAGVIHDQVKKSDDLSWVVGDDTKGVIDERGVYLSGASGFIPRVEANRLAAFTITTIVPAPYLTVTQGSVPTRTRAFENPTFESTNVLYPGGRDREKQRGERAYTVSVSEAVIPTDSVSLVAGRFATKSLEVEGVTLTTYFYEQDAGAMDLWLRNCAETVKRYAPILGPYPHPKFDIVSNFFQSGYGMPGWTLLGDRVIRYVTAKARRSGGVIPPGYLDHEYVHGWYGNGLFVDYETGNWCEAITTYFANYLAKELESKEAGKEHRRGVLEKFAIRVRGEGDYPLRAFVQKTEDKDNDIGYGKGSMLFHMLRKQVGDETFFDTVLAFTQANVGEVVRWEDWFEAFSKASDQDIEAHVGPYLERPGLPALRLTRASPIDGKDGTWKIEVRIAARQRDEAPWPATVPVRITLADGTMVDRSVSLLQDPQTETLGDLKAEPIAVELDPDFHLLRRIADADIPQCLNRTLETPGGTVYVEDDAEAFHAVAGRIARTKGFDLKRGPAAIVGPTIVFRLGDPTTGIEVGGKTWKGEDIAVLRTTVESGHPVTRFTALSEAMTPRAMYATYYGWDTYVVFKGHVPVARGIGRAEESSTRRILASLDVSGINATLERLCAKELEGRRPGTEGHAKASAWLRTRLLHELGWVSTMPVRVPIARRSSTRDLVVRLGDREEVWEDAYRPLALDSTRWRARFVPLSEVGRLRLEGADPAAWAKAASEVMKARQVPVLIVEPAAEAAASLAAWLDTPEDLTEEARALLTKPGRDGKPRSRPPLHSWIAGRRSRTLPLASEPDLHAALRSAPPMIVLANGVAERLGALAEKDPRIRIDVAFQEVPGSRGQNLVAHLPARPSGHGTRPAVVLVCAHFDALGAVDGRFHPGADDNASGVAALLDALTNIQAPWRARADREVGLLVCLTDCEEWGLWGARAAAQELTERYDLRAVINVDSVGRASTKKSYVIGKSKHPQLADVVGHALATQGLELGTYDIDKYAFDWGSDHWPFHQAGIPAVSIWATDYAVMNTPADTLDKVEPEGIKKVAVALRDIILNHLDALAGD